jgi:hypothetical protein
MHTLHANCLLDVRKEALIHNSTFLLPQERSLAFQRSSVPEAMLKQESAQVIRLKPGDDVVEEPDDFGMFEEDDDVWNIMPPVYEAEELITV